MYSRTLPDRNQDILLYNTSNLVLSVGPWPGSNKWDFIALIIDKNLGSRMKTFLSLI